MPAQSNYFSSQLSKLLAALGKSQKELSAQTNISESKISKLQNGKLEPKHKDIQKIAKVLKVSPAFFFNTQNEYYPIKIGYILDERVYSILYNNPKQNILIVMGQTLESHTLIPNKTLTFLTHFKEKIIFSITLIAGTINLGDEPLTKGFPVVLKPDIPIYFNVGSSYILQIIGDSSKFLQLLQNYLPPEKLLKI